jgi:hypothetical protein
VQGHGGENCAKLQGSSSAAKPKSHYPVQMGLLVTLLIVMIALVGIVGYMVFQVRTGSTTVVVGCRPLSRSSSSLSSPL